MLNSFMHGKGIFIADIYFLNSPFPLAGVVKICQVQLTLPLHLFLSMVFSANSFPVDLWKGTEQ